MEKFTCFNRLRGLSAIIGVVGFLLVAPVSVHAADGITLPPNDTFSIPANKCTNPNFVGAVAVTDPVTGRETLSPRGRAQRGRLNSALEQKGFVSVDNLISTGRPIVTTIGIDLPNEVTPTTLIQPSAFHKRVKEVRGFSPDCAITGAITEQEAAKRPIANKYTMQIERQIPGRRPAEFEVVQTVRKGVSLQPGRYRITVIPDFDLSPFTVNRVVKFVTVRSTGATNELGLNTQARRGLVDLTIQNPSGQFRPFSATASSRGSTAHCKAYKFTAFGVNGDIRSETVSSANVIGGSKSKPFTTEAVWKIEKVTARSRVEIGRARGTALTLNAARLGDGRYSITANVPSDKVPGQALFVPQGNISFGVFDCGGDPRSEEQGRQGPAKAPGQRKNPEQVGGAPQTPLGAGVQPAGLGSLFSTLQTATQAGGGLQANENGFNTNARAPGAGGLTGNQLLEQVRGQLERITGRKPSAKGLLDSLGEIAGLEKVGGPPRVTLGGSSSDDDGFGGAGGDDDDGFGGFGGDDEGVGGGGGDPQFTPEQLAAALAGVGISVNADDLPGIVQSAFTGISGDNDGALGASGSGGGPFQPTPGAGALVVDLKCLSDQNKIEDCKSVDGRRFMRGPQVDPIKPGIPDTCPECREELRRRIPISARSCNAAQGHMQGLLFGVDNFHKLETEYETILNDEVYPVIQAAQQPLFDIYEEFAALVHEGKIAGVLMDLDTQVLFQSKIDAHIKKQNARKDDFAREPASFANGGIEKGGFFFGSLGERERKLAKIEELKKRLTDLDRRYERAHKQAQRDVRNFLNGKFRSEIRPKLREIESRQLDISEAHDKLYPQLEALYLGGTLEHCLGLPTVTGRGVPSVPGLQVKLPKPYIRTKQLEEEMRGEPKVAALPSKLVAEQLPKSAEELEISEFVTLRFKRDGVKQYERDLKFCLDTVVNNNERWSRMFTNALAIITTSARGIIAKSLDIRVKFAGSDQEFRLSNLFFSEDDPDVVAFEEWMKTAKKFGDDFADRPFSQKVVLTGSVGQAIIESPFKAADKVGQRLAKHISDSEGGRINLDTISDEAELSSIAHACEQSVRDQKIELAGLEGAVTLAETLGVASSLAKVEGVKRTAKKLLTAADEMKKIDPKAAKALEDQAEELLKKSKIDPQRIRKQVARDIDNKKLTALQRAQRNAQEAVDKVRDLLTKTRKSFDEAKKFLDDALKKHDANKKNLADAEAELERLKTIKKPVGDVEFTSAQQQKIREILRQRKLAEDDVARRVNEIRKRDPELADLDADEIIQRFPDETKIADVEGFAGSGTTSQVIFGDAIGRPGEVIKINRTKTLKDKADSVRVANERIAGADELRKDGFGEFGPKGRSQLDLNDGSTTNPDIVDATVHQQFPAGSQSIEQIRKINPDGKPTREQQIRVLEMFNAQVKKKFANGDPNSGNVQIIPDGTGKSGRAALGETPGALKLESEEIARTYMHNLLFKDVLEVTDKAFVKNFLKQNPGARLEIHRNEAISKTIRDLGLSDEQAKKLRDVVSAPKEVGGGGEFKDFDQDLIDAFASKGGSGLDDIIKKLDDAEGKLPPARTIEAAEEKIKALKEALVKSQKDVDDARQALKGPQAALDRAQGQLTDAEKKNRAVQAALTALIAGDSSLADILQGTGKDEGEPAELFREFGNPEPKEKEDA